MRPRTAYEEALRTELGARRFIASKVKLSLLRCPKCGSAEHYKDTRNGDPLSIRCHLCHWNYNLLRGTIFMQSHIELRCWLYIIYVYCSTSIPDLKKTSRIVTGCSITPKIARRALRRLRDYLADNRIFYGVDRHDMMLEILANHRRREKRQKDIVAHDIRPHQIRFPSFV